MDTIYGLEAYIEALGFASSGIENALIAKSKYDNRDLAGTRDALESLLEQIADLAANSKMGEERADDLNELAAYVRNVILTLEDTLMQ